MWVGREFEFSVHKHDNITINTLHPKDYSSIVIEICGKAQLNLFDAGFVALLEHMGVS
jgi:hypothetical protein